MTQVSKYPIPTDIYNRIIDIFAKSIAGLTTKSQVIKFLDDFLSPTEKIMLAKRLSIGFLVAKKYDYREISKTLRVSTSTVADVASLYRYHDSFRKVVDDILKEEEIDKFFLDLGEKVSSMLAKGTKGSTWFYARNEILKQKKKKAF